MRSSTRLVSRGSLAVLTQAHSFARLLHHSGFLPESDQIERTRGPNCRGIMAVNGRLSVSSCGNISRQLNTVPSCPVFPQPLPHQASTKWSSNRCLNGVIIYPGITQGCHFSGFCIFNRTMGRLLFVRKARIGKLGLWRVRQREEG